MNGMKSIRLIEALNIATVQSEPFTKDPHFDQQETEDV